MTEVLDRPRPSLARAEVRRLSSRRLVRVLLALGLLGLLAVVGLASATSFARTTPAQLAAAQDNINELVQQQNGFREQCLRDPNLPKDVPADQVCPPATSAGELRPEDFLDKQPFVLATELPNGAVAVAAAVAALAYVLGATSIGAEWTSRSMVALLFWEPRRNRVMAVKLAVLAGAVTVVAVLAQIVWTVAAYVMATRLGSTGPLPDGFRSGLLGVQARGVVLAVIIAFLGFAVSNLARSTGAALGAGFVYFAVAENAIRIIRPGWQSYLLSENAAALVLRGGQKIFVYSGTSLDGQGQFTDAPRELVLSNLHGGLVLGLSAAVLVGIGVAVFARRDLT